MGLGSGLLYSYNAYIEHIYINILMLLVKEKMWQGLLLYTFVSFSVMYLIQFIFCSVEGPFVTLLFSVVRCVG